MCSQVVRIFTLLFKTVLGRGDLTGMVPVTRRDGRTGRLAQGLEIFLVYVASNLGL
jgi:hypothetical protein